MANNTPPCDQYYPGFAPQGGNNFPDPDIGGGIIPEPPDPDNPFLVSTPELGKPPIPGRPGWYCPRYISDWYSAGSQGCVGPVLTAPFGERLFETKLGCDTLAGCTDAISYHAWNCDSSLLGCTFGYYPAAYAHWKTEVPNGLTFEQAAERCIAACNSPTAQQWACAGGSVCILGTIDPKYVGTVWNTEAECIANCGTSTENGWVCYPGDGCRFENNIPKGTNVYGTLSECETACAFSTTNSTINTGSFTECLNAGVLQAANNNDTLYSLWCNKFKSNNDLMLRYKGKDGKVIKEDGSNCPKEAPYVEYDGDGCRYCTPASSRVLAKYDSKLLGGPNSRRTVVIGTPGSQGNCVTGYVVELENATRGILKCTAQGYCNPPGCNGTLTTTQRATSEDINELFDEVSKFMINFNNKINNIEAVKLGFESDELYNFIFDRRDSNAQLVNNTKLKNTIFGSNIIDKVHQIAEQYDAGIFNASLPNELSLDRIKTSMSSDSVRKLKSLKNNLGETIDEPYIYQGIKNYLLTGDYSTLLDSDLNLLIDNNAKDTAKKELLRGLTPNQEEIISYGLINKKSINPKNSNYTLRQQKILENVYIPPSDIFEKLQVIELDGTINDFYVNNDQTIDLYDASGSLVTTNINLDHTISIYTDHLVRIPTVHNLANTYILNNYEKSIILKWLNIEHPYTLTVTLDDSDTTEFDYSVSAEVPNVIVLQLKTLDTSTVNQVDKPYSTISAKYQYITSPETDTTFQADILHRMGPWLNLSISYNDPILAYITEGTDPEIVLDSIYFNLNSYGSQLGDLSFTSNLPYLIFITPTNKFSRNPYGHISSMTTLNKRYLNFDYGLFETDTKVGLSSPLDATFSFNNGNLGINGAVDTQSIDFTFNSNSKALLPKTNYVNDTKVSRKTLGIRRYKKLLERIKLAYNLEDDIKVSQFDLFSRFTASEFFTLYNSTPKTLDTIKELIEVDTETRVVEVAAKDPIKSKLLSLKAGAEEVTQYITPEENFERFGGKYGK